MSSTPLIRAEELTKHYPSEENFINRFLGEQRWIKAVNGVSFTIDEGETLGLVGESGCGKSTLGRTLLQLETPTAGSVYYDGNDLTALSSTERREYRQDLQFIFQNPFASLNPRLTISDIIGEAIDIHGIASGHDREQRVHELLETVGLRASHASRYPHEFSGGQRQRIGIARALAVDPTFVVCDEPVSALDVSVQAQILNLLMDLQEEFGLSYLLIAHDLSVVNHIADRIAVMYLGDIVEVGTTEEIFTPPHHPYTEALLSAIPEPDPLWEQERVGLTGSVPSPLDPPSGCKFHTRCPEVIAPSGMDIDQSLYRELMTLRQRIETRELPLDRFWDEVEADVSGSTDRSDLTDEFVDRLRTQYFETEPTGVHRRRIDETFEHLAAGEWETAAEHLRADYESVCEQVEPLLSDTQNPKACHLYDQPRTDTGSESTSTSTSTSNSDAATTE